MIFILLIVSNYIIFFQLHHLAFDFYIKYVLLFYNVSHWLNILILNLDSWLFYEILISFQFVIGSMILFFIFFILGPHSLDFYFCFGFFCEFGFSFQICTSIQNFMAFKIWPLMFWFLAFLSNFNLFSISSLDS